MKLLLTTFILFFLCFLTSLNETKAGSDPFLAGVSVVDITPLPGGRMGGNFRERINTGVSDPLLAKTLYLKQGDTKAVLVFCDLNGIAPDILPRVTGFLKNMTDVPPENITIMATHTHTGPLYFGALRKQFHEKALETKGYDPYELLDFSHELVGRIVRGILEAESRLKPVEIKSGYAIEKRLAFHRRYYMKDGSVRFNPGVGNKNIVRPAGPIDPEVGLISFSQPGKNHPSSLLVSYALHLNTVGGTKHSGDYPYHLQKYLAEHVDPNLVSLYGTGTCGNINHIDVNLDKNKKQRQASEIGPMLAETVIQKLPELKVSSPPSLAVKRAVLEVPLQQYSREEVEHALRNMEKITTRGPSFLDKVRAYQIAALHLRGTKTIPLKIHAIRLNRETAIVTLPGEVFVELGLMIKEESPFETTLVIELANDAPGYIPTQKGFSEGSYEVVNSRVVSGSGEKMAREAIRLLGELEIKE